MWVAQQAAASKVWRASHAAARGCLFAKTAPNSPRVAAEWIRCQDAKRPTGHRKTINSGDVAKRPLRAPHTVPEDAEIPTPMLLGGNTAAKGTGDGSGDRPTTTPTPTPTPTHTESRRTADPPSTPTPAPGRRLPPAGDGGSSRPPGKGPGGDLVHAWRCFAPQPAALSPPEPRKNNAAPFGAGPSPRGDRCRTARAAAIRAPRTGADPGGPDRGRRGGSPGRAGPAARVPGASC